MLKATDELLKDHKMIRKAMSEWNLDNPKFAQLHKTLERIVIGHAWFEDKVFLPAMEKEPVFARQFLAEIYQEHKDIEFMLKWVRQTPSENWKDLKPRFLQLRSLLNTHFEKEEEALFPICENVLNAEGLNTLAENMRALQHEMRGAIDKIIS